MRSIFHYYLTKLKGKITQSEKQLMIYVHYLFEAIDVSLH